MKLVAGLFACLFLGACAAEVDDKGLEEDALLDGKADSFYEPTRHDLTLGVPFPTAITDAEKFHGFFFSLSGEATISLETAAVPGGPKVDTVIYLYQRTDAASGWGGNIATSDDISNKNRFSRLDGLTLGAGEYRLIVKGYKAKTRGAFQLLSTCTGPGCAAPPTFSCLFGDTYREFRDEPTFDTLWSVRLTSPDTLEALERTQAIAAVRVAYEDATTIDAAFAAVDGGEIIVTTRRHRATSRLYKSFEYGAGDNSYGAIFAADSAAIAAQIQDGDLYECSVDAGPGAGPGDDCHDSDACRDGLTCVGIVDGAAGKCVVAGPVSGEGATCDTQEACGEHLVCAGLTRGGDGICNPAWMRGTFENHDGGLIPDAGTLEVTVVAYGLATVDTDVLPSLVIGHEQPTQLLVTLTNPAGSEQVVFDGATQTVDAPGGLIELNAPVFFSGDESVNGTWTLRIQDRTGGTAGDLRYFGLTVTSRWD